MATMQSKLSEESTSEEQYVIGGRLRIIRGVYRHGSPVGTIVGTTRFYLDVDVPWLRHEVRVRKTSVVLCNDEQRRENFENVTLTEPLVGATLLRACAFLTKHGVRKGDEGLHAAIDLYLDVTLHQEVALMTKKGQCDGTE
jgi:hypothetical protein